MRDTLSEEKEMMRKFGTSSLDRRSWLAIQKRESPTPKPIEKNTRTGVRKSPQRYPFTEHMSLLVKQHMERMMNSSLAVLEGFDTEAYLAPQRMKKGEGDPMERFKFNQVASDAIPSNRPLQDARNPR